MASSLGQGKSCSSLSQRRGRGIGVLSRQTGRVWCHRVSEPRSGSEATWNPSLEIGTPATRGEGHRFQVVPWRGNLGEGASSLPKRDNKKSQEDAANTLHSARSDASWTASSTEAQVSRIQAEDVRPGIMRPDVQAALRSRQGVAGEEQGAAGVAQGGAWVAALESSPSVIGLAGWALSRLGERQSQ